MIALGKQLDTMVRHAPTSMSARVAVIAALILALFGLTMLTIVGWFVAPADAVQGEHARILYIHPACATMMYVGFGVATIASIAYLIPRTRRDAWDLIAVAGVKVGLLFALLVLATGSLWGRATWGVWWTWDARLTSTAVLVVLYLGYLALRSSPGDEQSRAKQSAFLALFAAVDIPIVHFSVQWWRTLHQQATLRAGDVSISGMQLTTLLSSFLVMGTVFVGLFIQQLRLEQRRVDDERESRALLLAERRLGAGTLSESNAFQPSRIPTNKGVLQ